MELLNLLEERVDGLVAELEMLRSENRRIVAASAEAVAGYQALQEENRSLREALAQEQQLKDEVLERVDAILGRLTDIANDG